MPSKSSKFTKPTDLSAGPTVAIPPELLDQVVKGPMSPADVHRLCLSLKKAIIERAMQGEMSHHLGYRCGEPKPAGQDNHRNGATAKTVLTDDGAVRVEIPRDRDGSFEPILIPKHEPAGEDPRGCGGAQQGGVPPPSASFPTARATCSGSGSSRPKARSSG